MILSFEDPAATVALLASTDVRIVSLTITEFGYRVPLSEGDHKLIGAALDGTLDGNVDSEALPPETRKATVSASSSRRWRSATAPARAPSP